MSRWKAAAIHCCISLSVIFAIATLMAMTWYPPLLAWSGGRLGILGIILCVDISIGPLLTLIVFKSGKPRLKFDLSVIALMQVLGLCYGLFILFEARLIYVVFAVDSFRPVTASDVALDSLEKARNTPYATLPLAGPVTVAVRMPADYKERWNLTLTTMSGGPDLHQYPEYYFPYAQAAQQVLSRALPLNNLLARDESTRAKLSDWLIQHKRDIASVKYVPFYGKFHDLTVLIDSGTAEILDTLPIKPI
jgi:hypothetical protein